MKSAYSKASACKVSAYSEISTCISIISVLRRCISLILLRFEVKN